MTRGFPSDRQRDGGFQGGEISRDAILAVVVVVVVVVVVLSTSPVVEPRMICDAMLEDVM